MGLDELKTAPARTVGTKQTLKAVQKGNADFVFIARDADQKVKEPVVAACELKGIPIVWIDTMAELGQACGIEVGSAAAAILK